VRLLADLRGAQPGDLQQVRVLDGHGDVGARERCAQRRSSRGPDGDDVGRRLRDEVPDGHVGDEASASDDDDVAGGQRHLAHQVAGDEDGAAAGSVRGEQVADPPHAVGVQPVDRLVQDEDLGVGQQGGGDAEALAHAEREAAGALAGHVLQPDHVDDLVDAAAGNAVGRGQRPQVLVGRSGRVHRTGLEQCADDLQRARVLGVGAAVDGDAAGGRRVQAEDEPHGRALAGAVRPQEAGDDAGLDGEAEVVDGGLGAVGLGQVPCLDHWGSFFAVSAGGGSAVPSSRAVGVADGSSCGRVTETSGRPRSPSDWSRPCSAAWSTTLPLMTVVPSGWDATLNPSNQVAHRGSSRPCTRISYSPGLA
jgi:hypothetical protein